MNLNPIKIAFLGSDKIAIPFLKELAKEKEKFLLQAVLTQPDRPSGRGREMKPNDIKKWALKESLLLRDPPKPGKVEAEWFRSLGIDLLIVMAYGHILTSELLESCPLGCFNLHASLLPAYRGASPIETALALGEVHTGISLMRVVRRMDAGPVVDSQKIPIHRSMTSPELRNAIAMACIPLLNKNLPDLLRGTATEIEQDESRATYCRKLIKSDGILDFTLSADQLAQRTKAFCDWPGTFFIHEEKTIKVGSAHPNELVFLQPGEVATTKAGELFIGTGKNSLQVLTLQKPGGKMLPSADFLRGYEFEEGTILELRSSKPLLVEGK